MIEMQSASASPLCMCVLCLCVSHPTRTVNTLIPLPNQFAVKRRFICLRKGSVWCLVLCVRARIDRRTHSAWTAAFGGASRSAIRVGSRSLRSSSSKKGERQSPARCSGENEPHNFTQTKQSQWHRHVDQSLLDLHRSLDCRAPGSLRVHGESTA